MEGAQIRFHFKCKAFEIPYFIVILPSRSRRTGHFPNRSSAGPRPHIQSGICPFSQKCSVDSNLAPLSDASYPRRGRLCICQFLRFLAIRIRRSSESREVASAATYVIAAAERTRRAPDSSSSSRRRYVRMPSKARREALNSTGKVTS